MINHYLPLWTILIWRPHGITMVSLQKFGNWPSLHGNGGHFDNMMNIHGSIAQTSDEASYSTWSWSYPFIFWLVVWNMFYDFPYIGNFIIPTDFHIFQKGLKPPTSIYPGIYIYYPIANHISTDQVPMVRQTPMVCTLYFFKNQDGTGAVPHGQIHVSPSRSSSDQISICAMVKSWILCLFRRGIFTYLLWAFGIAKILWDDLD
jgi:hypothetical protein